MNDWQHNYRLARINLKRGDSVAAMKHLQGAIDACPVTQRIELSRMFYYLGMVLVRLGKPPVALKSWASAFKLAKRGYGARMYGRFSNGYGMVKCQDSATDDFYAFRSVQTSRYLGSKESRCFQSGTERDMVFVLIADAFLRLRKSYPLASMGCKEKLALYRRAKISFPLVSRNDPQEAGVEGGICPSADVVAVDFVMNRVLDDDSRCSCGSGKPYRLCCGRLPSCFEIENGSF